MLNLKIEKYIVGNEEKWDNFVLNQSVNGTFLQTRNFLNYHNKKFIDSSLIIWKGIQQIVAVIPACEINEENNKIFFSHKGSTFGGIVISADYNNVEYINEVVLLMEEYLKKGQFNKVILKVTSDIFNKSNTNILEYILFKEKYFACNDLSFYINFDEYNPDVGSNFRGNLKRDFVKALKNELIFENINNEAGIKLFYELLELNMKKFAKSPVHTIEELTEFKQTRLKNIVDFFGVFYRERLVAGSMVFKFNKKVFHTQYLAMNYEYSNLFPMHILNFNLIKTAIKDNFEKFSFGTSTENNGAVLNVGLAKFKEGFGAIGSLNKVYYKELDI